MPALFSRDTNTPTMSGANPFQSSNANAVAAGQENQTTEAQQHKQVLEKKAAADKKYVQENCCRKAGCEKASRAAIMEYPISWFLLLTCAQQPFIRQPFGQHHEPCQPEALLLQAEADQQAVSQECDTAATR